MGQYEREMLDKHERALEALWCATGALSGRLKAMNRALNDMDDTLKQMAELLKDIVKQEAK